MSPTTYNHCVNSGEGEDWSVKMKLGCVYCEENEAEMEGNMGN